MKKEIVNEFFKQLERNADKKVTNISISKDVSDVYRNVDGLSLQNVFFTYNEYFPNCLMFSSDARSIDNFFDTKGLYDELTKNVPDGDDISTINYTTYNLSTNETFFGFCIIYNKANLFARFERNVSESYILYGNNDEEALKKLIEISKKFYQAPEPEKNNLFMIGTAMGGGYALVKSHVKDVADFSVSKHYNDDFAKENEKIEKFINESDRSGLVILHGEKGTGKTTYIRHLINTHPDRKFVTVPASLINLLGEASFATFLMALSEHVIILEDCENAIRDRKSGVGSSASVSLLLNMTDGLLSDDLGIKFICTFNEDVRNIDPALMRKGRLVSKYEFKPLNVEKTNKLIADIMGEDAITVTTPMTLADIYNIEDDSYEVKRTSLI